MNYTKVCSKCQLEKSPISDFYKSLSSQAWCKDCHRQKSRENYHLNSDREIARKCKFQRENPELTRQRHRSCRAKNPEKYREQGQFPSLSGEELESALHEAWHYSNLQPLWGLENIKKRDKIQRIP
jgi:hypothetical protein